MHTVCIYSSLNSIVEHDAISEGHNGMPHGMPMKSSSQLFYTEPKLRPEAAYMDFEVITKAISATLQDLKGDLKFKLEPKW